jgi:proteasome lid subunit RPN8/RPN11
MARHAVAAYPEECCGILVGRWEESWHVERAVPAENIAEGDRRRRYQMDWETLFRVTREVRRGQAEMIGFYHSHPNATSVPSATDVADAWRNVVYAIIPVDRRQVGACGCWLLPPEATAFLPLSVETGSG